MQKIIDTLLTAIKGDEKNFTSGSINRAIVLLSIPMVIEMLGEGLFAIVDAFFVGRISNAAVTTVGLTETVATLIYSLAIGISIAATAMVARRIGENKPDEAARAAMQAIMLGVLVSCIVMVGGFFFAGDILRLMGADAEVLAQGTTYTRILLSTNVVIMLLFILNGIFRGAGDASMAMVSLWVANGLNIVLDPLLIFGIGFFPEMGLTGAAVATSIGRGTGVAFQLFILFGGSRIIKVTWQHVQVIPAMLRKLLDIASTGAMQFLIASASWIFLARIMASFGNDVYAGYTFAIRIVIFTILPSWGISNAASTLVGQNLGAGHPERAEKSVWRAAFYNMIFLLTVSIGFWIWAESLIQMFTDDVKAIEAGVMSLRIFCIGYIFYAYGMVVSQAFGGAGDTRTPTVINLICFWLVEIPLAYLLARTFEWGPSGVIWAIAVSESLLAVLAIAIFRKGRWKFVKV